MVMSGFVLASRTEDSKEDSIELPTEEDGTLLLSVLQSQFEGASGLRYRNPTTGSWRAVKLSDGILRPPTTAGWGETTYYVVMGTGATKSTESTESTASQNYYIGPAPPVGYSSDGAKRMKLEDHPPSSAVGTHTTQPPRDPHPAASLAPSEDLIVLGLEWTVTTEDLRLYFEKFGSITSAEVKTDPETGRSRGFGFIRFADPEVRQRVCELNHSIKGRKVDVRFPKTSAAHPTKLFVGCLPLKPEVEREELEAHFSEFGTLTDVYIPRPYRGFGFISFKDPTIAQRVLNMQHTLRKSQLNLSFADPKGMTATKTVQYQTPFSQPEYSYGYGYGQYPQYSQHSAYSGHPQAGGGYSYDAYATGNGQQARANYDRGYMDGRTHAQYSQSQSQAQHSLPQNPAQAQAPYTHPQYQTQAYTQQQREQYPPQSVPRPPAPQYAGTHGPPGGGREQVAHEYQRGYDLKGVWSNY